MGKPVVHFEVIGRDGAKLQKFYSQLFDWKIDANNPMNYGMVDTGAKQGIPGGIGGAGAGNEPYGVTVYVQVDDLQAYLNKAEKLGAKTVMPPTEIPGSVTFAQLRDPEGHLIGLLKG